MGLGFGKRASAWLRRSFAARLDDAPQQQTSHERRFLHAYADKPLLLSSRRRTSSAASFISLGIWDSIMHDRAESDNLNFARIRPSPTTETWHADAPMSTLAYDTEVLAPIVTAPPMIVASPNGHVSDRLRFRVAGFAAQTCSAPTVPLPK